ARVAPAAREPQMRSRAERGATGHLRRGPAWLSPEQAALDHGHPRRLPAGRDPPRAARGQLRPRGRRIAGGEARAPGGLGSLAPAAGAATIEAVPIYEFEC